MRLEDITAQNPWWRQKDWEKDDRHLKQLERYRYVYQREGYLPEKSGPVVAYGPRQVGKTTWIKQAISAILKKEPPESVFYLNAETARDRFDLYETTKLVDGLYGPKHIFIDEVSAIPDWEKAIKALADEGVLADRHVLLTGSSSLNIMKKAERLPGRMAKGQYKFRYYPLSFREVASLYGVNASSPREALGMLDRLNPLLYRYFLHGGYIRAINSLHEKGALEEDLFSVYCAWIDGEIAKARRSTETAAAVMDGVSNALTNDVSWSSLARGLSHVTIAEYAEILRDMFVVGFLEKAKRAGAGAPKNKKIYFTDPFIYWVALFKARKISSVRIADIDSATAGKLAELSAYSAISQHLDLKKRENDFDLRRYVHFERERSGETDFIVNYEKKAFRLECKFGQIESENKGMIYLTRDSFGMNKIPLSVFLMFPEASLDLLS